MSQQHLFQAFLRINAQNLFHIVVRHKIFVLLIKKYFLKYLFRILPLETLDRLWRVIVDLSGFYANINSALFFRPHYTWHSPLLKSNYTISKSKIFQKILHCSILYSTISILAICKHFSLFLEMSCSKLAFPVIFNLGSLCFLLFALINYKMIQLMMLQR